VLSGPRRTLVGVWVLLGVVVVSAAAWGAVSYVKPGDWQYQELDKLGQAGLLVGHPAGPITAWADKLSRFEAATLTLRAVEGIGQAYQAKGQRLQQLAQVEAGAPPATPETAPASPPGPALRAEDLLRVQKLVEEFRTELVTMGEKQEELETSMKLMLGMVTDLQKGLDAVAADQKKHKIDGYIQFRFGRDNATSGKQNFTVRRTRVNFRGPVSAHTSYRIELQADSKESITGVDFTGKKTTSGGPGSKVQVRTVALDYKLTDTAFVEGGQVILPWGYELQESVPNLWTGERAFFMDRLFPDQRGIGTYVEFRPGTCAPLIDVGGFNDIGINSYDTNDHVNALARVKWPFAIGSAAISAWQGETGTGPNYVDQTRYGIGTQLAFGDTQFLAEGVIGQDRGHDVSGWYGQIGHPLVADRRNLLFAKYDVYDENRDLSNDLFHRWSLGYWYELDASTRLTFVYQLIHAGTKFSDYKTWNGNAEYLQWQVKF